MHIPSWIYNKIFLIELVKEKPVKVSDYLNK